MSKTRPRSGTMNRKTSSENRTLRFYKQQIRGEIQRIEANSSAKQVAGKAIGRYGLWFITTIVIIGVIASIYLEQDKLAPVMGLLGSSLTALISLLASIAGANDKEERPEFEVIRELIDKLHVEGEEDPFQVRVMKDGEVHVKKGNDEYETSSKTED